MLVDVRAIILSKTKYGESDLILKIITADGEVYSVIAKSALKSKKRFGGGVLEPTHFVTATLNRKMNFDEEKLSVLNEAQIIDDFRGLKTDYDRLDCALQFVKMVGVVAKEGDEHKDLFNLLGHALRVAQTCQNLSQLKLQFFVKLLHLQGVLPPFEKYTPYLRLSIKDTDQINVQADDAFDVNQEIRYLVTNYVGY